MTAGYPQQEWIFEGTKREATQFEAQKKIESGNAKLSVRASPSLLDFATRVYAPHATTHLSDSTWSKVRVYQVATLVRHLGKAKLTAINVEMVQAYKEVRAGEGAKASSINNELRVLKTIMRYAKSIGHPCAEPEWRRLPEIGERRAQAWTDEEMQRILDACAEVAPAMVGIVAFLANTGCRKGEAIAAQWSWLDLDAGLIRIPVNAEWQPKSRRWRDVPIPDVLRPLLEAERKHAAYVFPASHGGPYGRFPEGLWRRVRARAGVTGGPHQLRHTYASHFLKRVPDLQLLADVLGHSSTRVTELYRHLLPGHLERARNAVQFGSLAVPLAMATEQHQTGSETASDTSSVELLPSENTAQSERSSAENDAQNNTDALALWRNSGDGCELVSLALALRSLDVACPLDAWLASGGDA